MVTLVPGCMVSVSVFPQGISDNQWIFVEHYQAIVQGYRQHPVVCGSGGETKVQCCKEQ